MFGVFVSIELGGATRARHSVRERETRVTISFRWKDEQVLCCGTDCQSHEAAVGERRLAKAEAFCKKDRSHSKRVFTLWNDQWSASSYNLCVERLTIRVESRMG